MRVIIKGWNWISVRLDVHHIVVCVFVCVFVLLRKRLLTSTVKPSLTLCRRTTARSCQTFYHVSTYVHFSWCHPIWNSLHLSKWNEKLIVTITEKVENSQKNCLTVWSANYHKKFKICAVSTNLYLRRESTTFRKSIFIFLILNFFNWYVEPGSYLRIQTTVINKNRLESAMFFFFFSFFYQFFLDSFWTH